MRDDIVAAGAVLLVVGVVLTFIPFTCFFGLALIGISFIILLLGLVLAEDKPTHVVYVPQQPPPYPQQAPPPPPVQPQPQQQPAKPFCSNCGGRVEPSQRFCPHCGSGIS
jgi:predicted lipid-binding transport protein (Tim44 family)